MHLFYYSLLLFIFLILVYRVGANPFTIYFFPWVFLLLNYYFGPIQYLIDVPQYSSYLFLLFYVIFFVLGCVLAVSSFESIKGTYRGNNYPAKLPNWISSLEKIGMFGVVLYFYGRTTSGINFLLVGDLASIRNTFIQDTNLFSQVGALIIGFYFITISKALFYGKNFKFRLFPLILFILTPLLTAGRQLYLILALLIFFSLLFLRKYRGGLIFLFKSNKRLMYPVVVGSFVLILFVSVFRFNVESQLYFGDKLGMFQNYSAIRLRDDYTFLTSLPQSVFDIIIEFFYYFGAQLARYHELFSALDFDPISFDLLSKTPVIQRNLDKIFALLGYNSSSIDFQYPELNIASFTWGTAIIGNLIYGGFVMTLFIQLIFAYLFMYSYIRFKRNPNDYPSFNLALISSVICVYEIMFSIISDTSILVYYSVSVLMFIHSLRKSRIN